MKEIKLTRGLVAVIDDEDYPTVSQYVWQADIHDNIVYASRWSQTNNVRTKIYMHRYIMQCKEYVDHKDGNGLNNRRYNLRKANCEQNLRNVPSHKDSTSKFKGVSFDKSRNKWMCQILAPGRKHLHLGRYINELDAAKVYDDAALKYFGEFARTNKMMGLY